MKDHRLVVKPPYILKPKQTNMKLETPITKENLFNKLQEKYPKGMKVFCDWIDRYKKAVNWHSLFNSAPNPKVIAPAPKFHDLPHAMQLGIWLTFAKEMEIVDTEIRFEDYNLADDIEASIAVLDDRPDL